MRKTARILLLLSFFVLSVIKVSAQANDGNDHVEMADLLRSNGKIYVVVVVLATILAGLFLYLIRLERKIGRLERETK